MGSKKIELEREDPSTETSALIKRWKDLVKPNYYKMTNGIWKKYKQPSFHRMEIKRKEVEHQKINRVIWKMIEQSRGKHKRKADKIVVVGV